jgi:hypothetical protein
MASAALKAESRSTARPGPRRPPARSQERSGPAPLHSIGNQALQRAMSAVRPGLFVGAANDAAEREADHTADLVMEGRTPPLRAASGPPSLRRKCVSCGDDAPCPACQAKRGQAAGVGRVLGSSGKPLDRATQAFFGGRFGRDFSDVRVHDDAAAAASARDMRAQAYTVGSDIAFARGRYAPGEAAGQRLLAHELAHVAQQDAGGVLRRAPDGGPDAGAGGTGATDVAKPGADAGAPPPGPGADAKPAADAGPGVVAATPHDATLHAWPTTGESVTFGGILLTENPNQLENLAWNLIAHGYPDLMISPGRNSTYDLETRLSNVAFQVPENGTCPEDDERCKRNVIIKERILNPWMDAVEKTDNESKRILEDFKSLARKNALDLLAINKQQAKAELIKYGIAIDPYVDCDEEGDCTSPYSMDESSPAALGLQKAAKLLLKRREAVDAKVEELNRHVKVIGVSGGGMTYHDEGYDSVAKEVEALKKTYNDSRAVLSAMFPVLAAFSDLDKSTDDLETIANTPPGQQIADLVGAKIGETLKNIVKSEKGLDPEHDDVNVWTLDPIVGLTKEQLGAETNPVLKTLVEEKVGRERPGPLGAICLGVLNIAAILLAAPTGGVSLAIAAGVNIAVTAIHVQEYLMQKALAGSAFDKARALSQDDPSLFWLAFEIVGTILDVGAAVAAFKTVGPLAKLALAAKEGEEADEALEALRIAARNSKDAKAAELADDLVKQVMAMRKGGSAAIGELGEEGKLIGELGEAAKLEATTEEIGKELVEGGSKFHVSKAGHVFSCSSPCTELGEKFADIFGKDEALAKKLEDLRKDAAEASQLEADGEIVQAEKKATEVKEAAAKLEQEIKTQYPTAQAVLTEEAELAKAEAALKFAVEGVPAAPKLLSSAKIAAATQKLAGKFPVLTKLSEGAVERIVRAGYAAAESGGGLRQAKRWLGAVRGQLLEEISAVRVRNLIGTAEGRVALGLDKEAEDLIFVEGSRIRDAEGAQLTDGLIVRQTKDRIEIVGVLESKAGQFAAGKLSEGLTGLTRMAARDLVEGARDAKLLDKLAKIDPQLAGKMSPEAIDAMDKAKDIAGKAELRERMIAAIDKLPEADLRPLRKVMQKGEGQVSLDIERLMDQEHSVDRLMSKQDRTVQIQLKDAQGNLRTVTAEVPTRPKFYGATPKGVSTADIAKQLKAEGFKFNELDLGELGMTKEQLNDIARDLVAELGSDLEAAAAKAAAKAPATTP